MRIAFFGGTFDPPHRGHLAIAKAAADRFSLDQVLFAPVATQPLKQAATPFPHRYAMTALATQADPRFIPSLLDAPQNVAGPNDTPNDTPNYTVDTLTRLRASIDHESSLYTLLGADSWLNISQWRHAPRLLTLSDWIVAARPGLSLHLAAQALPPEVRAEQDAAQLSLLLRHSDASSTRVFFLPETHEEISATELRNARHPDPTLVPASVRDYIRKANLYRAL